MNWPCWETNSVRSSRSVVMMVLAAGLENKAVWNCCTGLGKVVVVDDDDDDVVVVVDVVCVTITATNAIICDWLVCWWRQPPPLDNEMIRKLEVRDVWQDVSLELIKKSFRCFIGGCDVVQVCLDLRRGCCAIANDVVVDSWWRDVVINKLLLFLLCWKQYQRFEDLAMGIFDVRGKCGGLGGGGGGGAENEEKRWRYQGGGGGWLIDEKQKSKTHFLLWKIFILNSSIKIFSKSKSTNFIHQPRPQPTHNPSPQPPLPHPPNPHLTKPH